MAASVSATLTPSGSRHSVGDLHMNERTVTGDASYTAGGYVITAAALGFKVIKHAFGRPIVVTQAAAPIGAVDALVQADGSLKLLARQTTGAEVANATDLSALVVRVALAGQMS